MGLTPSGLHLRSVQRRFGDRGSLTVRRLANPITLCDGHGAFVMAASRVSPMAAYTYG
jgi:hypothetical protein